MFQSKIAHHAAYGDVKFIKGNFTQASAENCLIIPTLIKLNKE